MATLLYMYIFKSTLIMNRKKISNTFLWAKVREDLLLVVGGDNVLGKKKILDLLSL